MRVTTYRSMTEVQSVHDAWRSLQVHPWSDHDYYMERLARRADFRRPHVVAVERGGEVGCLLAARVTEETLPWEVGGREVLRARARVLRTSSGALMGSPSREEARALVRALLEALAAGEADAVYLHQLDDGCPLAREAREFPHLLARDHFTRRVPRWTLELPESYAAWLASRSRSTRKHLRRGERRITRELPGLRLVCYRDPADLDRLARDTEAVAHRTYQRDLGVGFVDGPTTREDLGWLLAAGWLRARVLYDGSRPIAFAHDLHYRDCLHMGSTGYDPEFAHLSPGSHLLARIIECCCESDDTRRIDLGAMDAPYKQDVASHRSHLVSAYIFSSAPQGLVLALARGITGAADRLARRVLGGERARRWARRLRSPARSGPRSS